MVQSISGNEYDIVGFDPRGVSRTTPLVSIFPTKADGVAWDLTSGPIVNATPDALAYAYARAQVLGDVAAKNNPDIVPYVNTPLVATDLLNIVKAFGRDKLQYYGLSYASTLGMTYVKKHFISQTFLLIDFSHLHSVSLQCTRCVLLGLFLLYVVYYGQLVLQQNNVGRMILDGNFGVLLECDND